MGKKETEERERERISNISSVGAPVSFFRISGPVREDRSIELKENLQLKYILKTL